MTGFALAVEIGDWTRFSGASIGAFVGLTPSEHSSGSPQSRARSPRPATAMPAGCWSKRPGTTAPATGREDDARPVGARPRSRPGPRGCGEPAAAPAVAEVHRRRKKRGTIAAVAIARELAGWCWSLATLEE